MAVSTVLSPLDVMQYMWDAGFRYNGGLVNGLAVSYAETAGTLDPKITNQAGNTPPSVDRGLWQLNSYWHSEVSDAVAFDGALATKEAYRIYKANGNFNSWSAFNNGAYLKYMPAAYATYNCFVVVQDLRNQLTAAKSSLAIVQGQLTAANNNASGLQTQLSDANAKIALLSQGQEDLIAKLDQAVADRQDAITHSEQLEGEVTDAKAQFATYVNTVHSNFDTRAAEKTELERQAIFPPDPVI